MKDGKKEIVISEKKMKKTEKKKKLKKRINKAIGKVGKLDRINPYLHALVDPWNIHGLKVPDFTLDDSCTFYSRLRQVFTAGSNGCCGAAYGINVTGISPNFTTYGGLVPYNTGAAPTAYKVGMIFPSACTTSAFLPSAPTSISLTNFDTGASTIPNNFPRVRLVSFGVRIMYTGNALNRQGKITVAYAPSGTFTNKIANSTIGLNDILLLPHSTVVSIPLVGSAMVTWRPTDFEDQNYCEVGPAAAATPVSAIPPSGSSPCEIYVFVDGAVANQTFFVEAIWNFEAIATNATLSFITPTPSKSDPIGLAHAANRLADLPATRSLPEGKMVEEPKADSSTVHVENHDAPSMLDSVLSGGQKVLGFAKNAYDTLSPLAESVLAFL